MFDFAHISVSLLLAVVMTVFLAAAVMAGIPFVTLTVQLIKDPHRRALTGGPR